VYVKRGVAPSAPKQQPPALLFYWNCILYNSNAIIYDWQITPTLWQARK
jgi:hypothetical protein